MAVSGFAMLSGTSANASTSDNALRGTPFESGANAAALPRLASGASLSRSSVAGTLTADDRTALGALNLGKMHAAAVAIHRIPKTNAARQLDRLRSIARSVDAFTPSGACDAITPDGDGKGTCTGTVEGVRVRMPVGVTLSEGANGMLRMVVRNIRPLEAKTLFFWSRVVDADHLKVVVDFYPTDDAWLVYTRVGVEMAQHESSASELSAAMLKLDTWLVRDLSRL